MAGERGRAAWAPPSAKLSHVINATACAAAIHTRRYDHVGVCGAADLRARTTIGVFAEADRQRGNQLKRLAESTLGSGNLRVAVQVPDGELLEEWLAVHTVEFFNHLNILYGTLTELCTSRECPVMCAGPRFEYHWQDPTSVKYRRSTRLSAPDYIECLLNWTQAQMDDEQLFPVQPGAPFPPQFVDRIKAILRRLFRIYAHVYHHHFAQVCAMRLETHLNTSYRHFFLFVSEYHLIDPKEMVPLVEINEAILEEQARQTSTP